MLVIEIAGTSIKSVFGNNSPITICELWQQIEKTMRLSYDQYYIVHNGRLMYENDICSSGLVTIVPRLLGGKGGFGSMLRAIGAQIEKTTNREACRDLSGRRLRDINEEKRLKAWIEKQSKREEEAAERKKRKLVKLCAVPKHEFKDRKYEQERAELTERVGDAVEEGFKAVCTSGTKRKFEQDVKPNKRKTILDLDIDSDELDTSDDSDNENISSIKMTKVDQQISNDSGHSSDENTKVNKSNEKIGSEYSESSSDNQITHEISATQSVDIKNIDSIECPEVQSPDCMKKATV